MDQVETAGRYGRGVPQNQTRKGITKKSQEIHPIFWRTD